MQVSSSGPPERHPTERQTVGGTRGCTADYTPAGFDGANASRVPLHKASARWFRDIMAVMSVDSSTTDSSDDAHSTERSSPWRWVAVLGLGVAGAALANAVISARTPPLGNPFSTGIGRRFSLAEGDIWYARLGSGPPLLLLHSPSAGASSYEWTRCAEALGAYRTVYAVDLPGYGKSDRPAVPYDSQYYLDVLAQFCKEVIANRHPTANIDLSATSLTCAWAAVLADQNPELIGRCVFVSPTGFPENPRRIPFGKIVGTLLRIPVAGKLAANLATSRRAVRQILTQRIFADPDIASDDVVARVHQAAHQPGPGIAWSGFVDGSFETSSTEAFRKLRCAPLLVFGEAAQSPEGGDFRRCRDLRPDAPVLTIPRAGALPQFESPEQFVAGVVSFLDAPTATAPSSPG